jgi:hypothetical protein
MREGPWTVLRLGEIRPLRDVLVEIGELVDPDGRDVKEYVEDWLFLPRRRPWTLGSPAVLLELSEDEEDDEEAEMPELAKKEGLKLALEGADVQSIICNARQQKRDVSLDEIFAAFLYYYDFDAFKDLS